MILSSNLQYFDQNVQYFCGFRWNSRYFFTYYAHEITFLFSHFRWNLRIFWGNLMIFPKISIKLEKKELFFTNLTPKCWIWDEICWCTVSKNKWISHQMKVFWSIFLQSVRKMRYFCWFLWDLMGISENYHKKECYFSFSILKHPSNTNWSSKNTPFSK